MFRNAATLFIVNLLTITNIVQTSALSISDGASVVSNVEAKANYKDLEEYEYDGVLPSFVDPLPKNDPRYAELMETIFKWNVVGKPDSGNLKNFVIVEFTRDYFAHRTYGGSAKENGYWWYFQSNKLPSNNNDDNNNAASSNLEELYETLSICPEWGNTLDYTVSCQILKGSVFVIGQGQTYTCDTGDNNSTVYKTSGGIRNIVTHQTLYTWV